MSTVIATATAPALLDKIGRMIERAWSDEPCNSAARAQCFVARLSGAIHGDDPAVSTQLFALLSMDRAKPSAPSSPDGGA